MQGRSLSSEQESGEITLCQNSRTDSCHPQPSLGERHLYYTHFTAEAK